MSQFSGYRLVTRGVTATGDQSSLFVITDGRISDVILTFVAL